MGLDGPGVVGARWSAASSAAAAEKSGGDRWRLRCGGGLGVWRSLGATRGSGGANGGISAGGAAMEVRGDGELRASRRSGGGGGVLGC